MDTNVLDWEGIKAEIDLLGLHVRYTDRGDKYKIIAGDGISTFTAELNKVTPSSSDQNDFETNYKPGANKPAGVRAAERRTRRGNP